MALKMVPRNAIRRCILVALAAASLCPVTAQEVTWDPVTHFQLEGRTVYTTVSFPGSLVPASLWATDQGVYFVQDAGDGEWIVVPKTSGLPPGPVKDLAPDPSGDPNTFYAVTEEGVFKTTDQGGSWQPHSGGLPEGPYSPTRFATLGSQLFVGMLTPQGNGIYSSDGTALWGEVGPLPQGREVTSLGALRDFYDNPILAAGTYPGGLFGSGDSGASWYSLGITGDHAAFVEHFAGDPAAPGTWYAANGGAAWSGDPSSGSYLWTTYDGGATWYQVVQSSGDLHLPVSDIELWETPPPRRGRSTAFSPAFFSTSDGLVRQSLDGGTTWTDVSAGLPAGRGIVGIGQMAPYLIVGLEDGGIYRLRRDFCQPSCEGRAVPASGPAPLSVAFDAEVEASGCTWAPGFAWAFGDGEGSTEQDPSHTYAAPGVYTWMLTVAVDGRTCTRTGTVTVAHGVPGDCDYDGSVSIGEVQRAIGMFLGSQAPSCGVDCDGDGAASIGEVQRAIGAFLGTAAGCP